MQAMVSQTQSKAMSTVPSQRRSLAQITGATLAMTLVMIIVEHAGPALIAGQRVSGTSDLAAIRAFYSHHSLLPFYGLTGMGFIGLAFFALSFRAYLRTFQLTLVGVLLVDLATALALLEAPLIAIQLGLQSALVQVVASGSDNGVLAVFASWDWIYNGTTYWFEATWMACWAVLAWRVGALPKWIAVVGGIGALGLLFNAAVLTLRIPDVYTLAPTAVLIIWMIGTASHLVRGGTQN